MSSSGSMLPVALTWSQSLHEPTALMMSRDMPGHQKFVCNSSSPHPEVPQVDMFLLNNLTMTTWLGHHLGSAIRHDPVQGWPPARLYDRARLLIRRYSSGGSSLLKLLCSSKWCILVSTHGCLTSRNYAHFWMRSSKHECHLNPAVMDELDSGETNFPADVRAEIPLSERATSVIPLPRGFETPVQLGCTAWSIAPPSSSSKNFVPTPRDTGCPLVW